MATAPNGLSRDGPAIVLLDHLGRHMLGIGHRPKVSARQLHQLDGWMLGAQLALDLAASHPAEAAWIARRMRYALVELDGVPAWQRMVADLAGYTRRFMTDFGE